MSDRTEHVGRRPGISGLVHTKNEAGRIAAVVTNLLRFCDEVVVADMASTDGTERIAAEAGARVVRVPDFGYVEPARSLAVAETRHEWILNLDADELVERVLAERIAVVIADDEHDIVYLSRLNYLSGEAVHGAGWQPANEYHPRLYKARMLEHHPSIHSPSTPATGARILRLPVEDGLSIVHFNFLDWRQYLEKSNRYTSVEAAQIVAGNRRRLSVFDICARSVFEMGRHYLALGGFRDGFRGFALSVSMGWYYFATGVKARELDRIGDATVIQQRYDAIRDRVLEDFDRADG